MTLGSRAECHSYWATPTGGKEGNYRPTYDVPTTGQCLHATLHRSHPCKLYFHKPPGQKDEWTTLTTAGIMIFSELSLICLIWLLKRGLADVISKVNVDSNNLTSKCMYTNHKYWFCYRAHICKFTYLINLINWLKGSNNEAIFFYWCPALERFVAAANHARDLNSLKVKSKDNSVFFLKHCSELTQCVTVESSGHYRYILALIF